MRAKKAKRIMLGAVIALAGLAVFLYVQSQRDPGDYQPIYLASPQEKDQAAKEFISRIGDFGNYAQKNERFTWEISQEQINRYLSASDDIAYLLQPQGRQGQVDEVLQRSGLTGPAVSLDDGVLTLMARRSTDYSVISASVEFFFTDKGEIMISLAGGRVGRLMIPAFLLKSQLNKVQPQVGQFLPTREGNGLSQADAAELAKLVQAVLQDLPVAPEFNCVNKKRVRIEGIEIKNGLLRLQVLPVRRERPAQQAASSANPPQPARDGSAPEGS